MLWGSGAHVPCDKQGMSRAWLWSLGTPTGVGSAGPCGPVWRPWSLPSTPPAVVCHQHSSWSDSWP